MSVKIKAGILWSNHGLTMYGILLIYSVIVYLSWEPQSYPFGWEPDADGFRGYIFVSEDNSTVVLSIKGTSAGWAVGGGGPTVKKDKLNDNLMFSCCCARVGPTWSTVCDCYSGGYKCDQSCLQNALTEESLFYNVAIVSAFFIHHYFLLKSFENRTFTGM